MVLGVVAAPDKASEPTVVYFRRGFTRRLEETKAFATVVDAAPTASLPAALVVSGRITEIDKGSRAARLLIGFGAGRQRVQGSFEITDAQGKSLAKFDAAKAYSGGAGIGGGDFLDMDELMEKFGTETADAVVRWTKGGKLDGP
jgi:hypothetical protein